jgi:hypothetical protein
MTARVGQFEQVRVGVMRVAGTMASGTHFRQGDSTSGGLTVGACSSSAAGCGSDVAQFGSRNIKFDHEGLLCFVVIVFDHLFLFFLFKVMMVWGIFIRLFVIYSFLRGRAGWTTGTRVDFRFWGLGQLVGREGLVAVDGFAIGNHFGVAVLSAALVRAALGRSGLLLAW